VIESAMCVGLYRFRDVQIGQIVSDIPDSSDNSDNSDDWPVKKINN